MKYELNSFSFSSGLISCHEFTTVKIASGNHGVSVVHLGVDTGVSIEHEIKIFTTMETGSDRILKIIISQVSAIASDEA